MAPEDAAACSPTVPRPGVCPRGPGHLSTFLTRELPLAARQSRDATRDVPIRVLFGTRDAAVVLSMVSPETANADDYTLETVDATPLRRRRAAGPGAQEADRAGRGDRSVLNGRRDVVVVRGYRDIPPGPLLLRDELEFVRDAFE